MLTEVAGISKKLDWNMPLLRFKGSHGGKGDPHFPPVREALSSYPVPIPLPALLPFVWVLCNTPIDLQTPNPSAFDIVFVWIYF